MTNSPQPTWIIRGFLLMPLLLACFGFASAATITVTNNNDSGAGSLRQAISDSSPGDTIDFDSSLNGETITLTSGELSINKQLTITGPDANLLAVNGNNASRVFHVGASMEVTISGLTITHGFSLGDGGGILNDGSVTITDSTLSVNSASLNGGGIHNSNGSATITNSTFLGNSASVSGGGVYNNNGTLTITNSTLNGNGTLFDGGGGIYNNSGSVTITNSTLSGSVAPNFGGGISNSGSLTITNSTLSGNSTYGQLFGDGTGVGGGITNNGSVTIANSTLSRNGADSNGGGIWNGSSGSVTIANSTLSGNETFFDGGGIYNRGSVTITNTILNAGTRGANIANSGSSVVSSLGYNISSDDGGLVLNAPGDHINTDPQLTFLQDNGGPTFTHALLPGSPAIDAGDPAFDAFDYDPPLLYDQRGPDFARVAGNRIDIGAFEVQTGPTPTPTPTPTPVPTATPTPTSTPGNPNINVSPPNLVFGTQPVGTTSAQMTITISNTGAGDLHIFGLSVAGANPVDFAIANLPSTTITPGNNSQSQMTFTPSAIGARSATLSISSDDPHQPIIIVDLSGNGTEATPTPTPTSTPTSSPTPIPTATPTPTPGLTEADLLIGIGVDRTTVRQGDLLTYTITVRNFGPDTAINALVNDVLSSGSTFISASADRGFFTAPAIGQTGTVTWYMGDILNNGQESARIVVTVIVRGNTTITNTATVSSPSNDPNTANNTASITVSVVRGGGNGHGH